MLEIRLLGQFAVARDGRPLSIPSRPAQLLLAWLALNAGRPQSREELADRLWPDSSAANARANLRHALWQLRSALDDDPRRAPCLRHDTHTITLEDCSAVDTAALAREHPVLATDDLLAAVSVYRGELLPGFYEPWVVLERERLAAVYDRRMTALLDRLAGEGRWDEVVEWAERWIARGDAPEPGYRAIMRACAARGDVAGVAATYRRCRTALREALDVEPSTETRLLAERAIHAGVSPVVAGRPAPPNAVDPAAFERGRAEFYRRAARRSNRLALAALLGLAAAVGVALAGRRGER